MKHNTNGMPTHIKVRGARVHNLKNVDVETLLQVFQKLIENGANVIAIEYDLDVIRNLIM